MHKWVKFVNIFPQYLSNIALLNGFYSYLAIDTDCKNLTRKEVQSGLKNIFNPFRMFTSKVSLQV